MTRRQLASILLIGVFALNSFGLALWVHMLEHDHDSQTPETGSCAVCQLLTTARQDKGIVETPLFHVSDDLVATFLFESPVVIAHPAITSLYQRAPPPCA